MHNRSGRSQNVSPPSIVPGASIRPTVGIPWSSVHAFDDLRLAEAVRLAGTQRDRAAIADEQRVERVDEVGAVGLGVEHVDRRPERREQLHEPVVLALRDRQVARVEEAVGGIVERPAERRTRPLDEHVAQRRGHALGAEGALDGRHGARIAAGVPSGHGRLRRHGSDHARRPASRLASRARRTRAAKPTSSSSTLPAVEEVSGQPFLATLSYVWDDIREIWRQGMDVLRDPRIIP